MRKILSLAYITLAVSLLCPALSFGQEGPTATLTSVEVSDGAVVIKADGSFTYTVYKPSDPYTVIVELPGVSIGGMSPRITSDKKGISEIKLSETGAPSPSTKLEILLEAPADIEPKHAGNELTLNVKEAVAAPAQTSAQSEPLAPASAEAAPEAPAQPMAAKASSIGSVKFTYSDGSLNLIISGDGTMDPTVFSLDNKVVVDIPGVEMKAPLPESVVAPVESVRYGMHKDKVRVVVDLKEKTEFTALSKENSVVIAFKVIGVPAGAAVEGAKEPAKEEKPDEQAKYAGKNLSLDFQSADIVPILRLLGDVAGYNTVINPGVRGDITLKLINVPWDQALSIVLDTFNLEKQIEGNIMSIAPAGVFTKRKEDAERLKEASMRAEPLMQVVVQINYAEAANIQSTIENAKIKSPKGNVTVDSRMNTLIIQDTQTAITKIKDIVRVMDVPKSQVMIESKIVEVSTDVARTLGIRWGGSVQGGSVKGIGDTTNATFSVNTPTTPSTGPGGVLNLSIGTADSKILNLSIEAIETVNKLRKLSNPKILTMDNEAASIQQGASIPVQTTTAAGSTTQFVNANLNLNVTPRITPDGYIQIRVVAANDSPTQVGGATGIDKQSIQTQALVKNGETLVLGGIYTRADSVIEQGVPYLSKIPLIGWLFKMKSTSTPTREILIFITPTIVKKAEKNEAGI